MRAGLARGFSVPRAVLDGRDVSIANVAGLDDPEQSAFWKPFEKMPTSIPEAAQEQLRAEARKAIGEQLIQSFGQMLTRSEGRRGGKEWVRKSRMRWSVDA